MLHRCTSNTMTEVKMTIRLKDMSETQGEDEIKRREQRGSNAATITCYFLIILNLTCWVAVHVIQGW